MKMFWYDGTSFDRCYMISSEKGDVEVIVKFLFLGQTQHIFTAVDGINVSIALWV